MNISDTVLIFTTLAFKNIFLDNFRICLTGTLEAKGYNVINLTLENFIVLSPEQRQINPNTIKLCVFILPEYDNHIPDLSQAFISIISIQSPSFVRYKLITIKITNVTPQHNPQIYNLVFNYPTDKLDKLFSSQVSTNRIQIQESKDGTMYQFFQKFNLDTLVQNIICKS